MSNALVHRGPDGAGKYIDPQDPVFLAHRRLAILDIAGGEQPMWNEDRSVVVVFNGEIYNHLELRKELASCGHIFASDHSDTEVLVHGYEQWGDALPERLNGMFAFAIYDLPKRTLFLARDRFGKKPLYYTERQGLFAFASELTALLSHPRTERRLDERSLQKYFAYGFIPAPNCLYRNTAKLPGGYWMTIDVATGKMRRQQYWQFRIEPRSDLPGHPEPTLEEELRALMSQAVKRRLISDVPLGVFLSGGIDSSAIVAFAAQHLPPNRINTFAVGFHEVSFDESGYANRVAKLFGSNHHHEVLDLDKAFELIPQVLAGLDEPMGDSSIVPTYLLSRFARQHVTVALGGDGGDELFAGYDPFKALRPAQHYRNLVPGGLHRTVRTLADLLPPSERNMSLEFRIKRALRGVTLPQSVWNPMWMAPLEPRELEQLFQQPIRYEDVFEEAIAAWNSTSANNLIDKTLEYYSRFYLQDDILTKVDRASMMVSLEVRAPFLDNDVVEFARRLPHRFKYRNGHTKYLLKKALAPLLPGDILYRRKKGFGVPLNRWLKRWKDAAQMLPDTGLDQAFVERQWQEHKSGYRDHRLFLWCWIVLQSHRSQAMA